LPTNTFADWAVPYALNAAVTNYQNDTDGDGLDNLTEYALGGNPTNGTFSAGNLPAFRQGGIEYVYRRRQDAAARQLSYSVELSRDLRSPAWGTNGIVETGSGVIDADFESVTNRITATTNKAGFVRLRIGISP
jgi:hypothetical protein